MDDDGTMSEDPVKVAPHAYKVLLENDRIRVLDFRLGPGEKTAMHRHPAYVVHVLSPSKVKFTTPEGRSLEIENKPGETFWHNEGSHAAENTGTKQFHALEIELK